MRYIDCTLTIKDRKNVSIEYFDGNKNRERDGTLAVNDVDMLTVERLNYWINYGLQMQEKSALQVLEGRAGAKSENPTRLDDLKLIGLILYKMLFTDPKIEEWFQDAYRVFRKTYQEEEARGQSADLRLRLKLVFQEQIEDLSNLPWEFLFVPGEADDLEGNFFSGQQTEMLLTRYVPHSALVKELIPREEQLRILVVVCSPSGLGGIDETEIEKLLPKMQSIPKVHVTTLKNLTYQELSHMINQREITLAGQESLYRKLSKDGAGTDPIPNSPYHILHFVGHGAAEGLYLIKDPNDDDYDAEDGDRQPTLYSALQFRKLFTNAMRKPRMIFLHACKGATRSQEGFKSTARQLVYAEIPAVVAMQYSISHSDAGIFARKFYEELGKGKGIDEAVKEGRMQLGMRTPPWEHPRFGTPVVYLQSEIANELVIPPPEREEKTERVRPEPGGLPQLAGNVHAESPAAAMDAAPAKPQIKTSMPEQGIVPHPVGETRANSPAIAAKPRTDASSTEQ